MCGSLIPLGWCHHLSRIRVVGDHWLCGGCCRGSMALWRPIFFAGMVISLSKPQYARLVLCEIAFLFAFNLGGQCVGYVFVTSFVHGVWELGSSLYLSMYVRDTGDVDDVRSSFLIALVCLLMFVVTVYNL